jgi:uncharacterized protein DUF4280
MGQKVTTGAMMLCTFGTGPSTLNVLPANKVLGSSMPAANIMDNKPFVNVPPFIMCLSIANPAVAAATTAALGVLTPMPCTPVLPAPWAPGSPKILVGNLPVLNNTSTCMCAFAGMISFTTPGQVKVQVP